MSVGAVNKQTGERIPTAGMSAVDAVLSGTSTNPVQNKVVKEALDNKQDTITFDSVPTDGSNNPVKSNGIYDSEKDIYAAMGEMGAKNLIPYPYDRESGYSSQGVTVTYDENGVMTVNKVAGTDTAYFSLLSTTLNPNIKIILKPNTRYILSLNLTNATNTSVAITKSTTGDISAIRNKSTGYYETVFTTPADMSVFTGILLYWGSSVTETNAIVEVMIRQASITDNTYQPYAKTNKQLTDDVALLNTALATKADTDMVAADFNAGTAYTAGNYCIYGGKFYKFNKNHSGAWAAADADEIKIAGELSSLNSKFTTPQSLPNVGVLTDANAVDKTCIAVVNTSTQNLPSGIEATCPMITIMGSADLGWGAYDVGIQILITNSGVANGNYYRVKYANNYWYPWGSF